MQVYNQLQQTEYKEKSTPPRFVGNDFILFILFLLDFYFSLTTSISY